VTLGTTNYRCQGKCKAGRLERQASAAARHPVAIDLRIASCPLSFVVHQIDVLEDKPDASHIWTVRIDLEQLHVV
jgi:hypothetical protein